MRKNKIAVSSYSFSNALYTEKMPGLEDLFKTIKELGIEGVELVGFNILGKGKSLSMGPADPDAAPKAVYPDGSQEDSGKPMEMTPEMKKKLGEMMAVFKTAGRTRPDTIDELKVLIEKYEIPCINMPIDFGDIGNPNEEERKADLDMLKMWIDIAAELKCPSIRINSGFISKLEDGTIDLTICINSYRELAEYGAPRGVAVTMENHGGATEQPEECIRIYEGINHTNFHLTPDVGNFHLGERMYTGIDMLFEKGTPLVSHIKTYAFDDEKYGEGCDSHTDFKRMAEIAKKHNYEGWYSIECNGACGKDYANVKKSKEYIEKYFLSE